MSQPEAVNWAVVQGLLPPEEVYHTCDKLLKLEKDHGLGRFRCHRCKYSSARSKGTIFEGSHLPVKQVLMLAYHWCQNYTYDQVIHELQLGDADL